MTKRIDEEKLDSLLLDLGHDDFNRGTAYLREAVKDYEPGMKLTGDLYPAIAKAHQTTAGAVERAVRYAIEKAWGRVDYQTQLRFFGHSIDPNTGKPKAGEYVARLARICREG